MKWDALIKGQ